MHGNISLISRSLSLNVQFIISLEQSSHHVFCGKIASLQVVDSFSSKSLRLMAIAVGVIPDAHAQDFSQMVRHEIESAATNLELLCLVVLTNNIREDSQDTIREVQERCSAAVKTFPEC